MIRIDNVNKYQKEMLDHMWEIQDMEELEAWKDELDNEDRQQAELLEELIILATLDEMMEDDEQFPEIDKIIKKISKRSLS